MSDGVGQVTGPVTAEERPASCEGGAPPELMREYRERRVRSRQVFRIDRDHLTVEARKTLGARTYIAIELRHVSPVWVQGAARDGLSVPWLAGILLASVLEVVVLASWHAYSPSGTEAAVLAFLGPVAFVLIAIGIVVNAMGLREYQFAGFTCEGYPRVFGICKLGPDADRFDSFLKTLAEAIREARASGDGVGGHTQDSDPAGDPRREAEEG